MKKIYLLIIIIALGFFLRIYQLESSPPGFYSDEASYAYNAYSILKTGRDEHGVFLPITTEAFGDFKLPVMLYSIVASFSIFGASEWAARLPGVLYGTATLLSLYFLLKKLRQGQTNDYLPLLATAILAIAPAHLFVSRGTWELTPALFFITTATLFFLKAITADVKSSHSRYYYIVSAILFVVSLYAYNSARVFVPLFGISLICIYRKQISQHLKSRAMLTTIILSVLVAFVLCLPILKAIRTPEVTQRAKFISIFYDKGVEARVFDAIRSDSGQPVKITQLLHNKPLFYFMDYAKRYLSHFDFNFLFITGDTFEIFQIIGLGFLPLIALPFFVIGLYSLCKNRPSWLWLVIIWLVIGPIASSFTIFTPSLSRAHNMIIPLVIICTYGVINLFEIVQSAVPKLNASVILTPVILVFFIANVLYIYYQYFIITPTFVAEKWNDGIKSEVEYVLQNQDKYEKIVVSSSRAPSYIFYAWFMRYDPALFQQQSVTDHTPDPNGLNFTSRFGKFYFTKEIATVQKDTEEGQRILFIGFEKELRDPDINFYSRNKKVIGEAKDTL